MTKIEVAKMAVSLLKNDINQMYIEYINNQITYTEYLNFKINTGKAIIYMEEHAKAMKV